MAIKWTIEKLKEEALKYEFKSDFAKSCPAARTMAARKGILQEICAHMAPSRTAAYTNKELQACADKFSTRGDFRLGDPNAYSSARRRNLLDKICDHMPKHVKRSGKNSPNFIWSFDKVKIEAKKYINRKAFQKGCQSAYNAAGRYGWLEEVCKHMLAPHQNVAYSLQELQEEANKYKTRSSFREENPSAYLVACRRKWLEQICTHMKRSRGSSKAEKELLDLVKEIYPTAKTFRDRRVKIKIKPQIQGFDIDIFVPELNKGIEFDGKYYHSIQGLKRTRPHWSNSDIKNYHKIKDKWFLTQGIKILHIKEEDWIKDKQDCIHKCMCFLSKI